MNSFAKIGRLRSLAKTRFFGFFQGHGTVTDEELASIAALVDTDENSDVERQYEKRFAQLIGNVEAVSFAAGRMAFYAALRALGIGAGDEVLLTGFTCSVMPNAVWRTGAAPRYADISENTFGTNPADVARKIGKQTRAVVVQHTFGIPCDVDAIVRLARERNIPVIEDCALTLGSTLDQKPVGTWGDAAIFSTDHSKPLNTLTGGMLVTHNAALAAKVRTIQNSAALLDNDHRRRLWQRCLQERKYLTPIRYGYGRVASAIANVPRHVQARMTRRETPVFLEADFKPRLKLNTYPYPARLPVFLARLGIHELDRWSQTAAHRGTVLSRLLDASPADLKKHFPTGYSDPRRQIIPLRLAYAHPAAAEIERRMRNDVDFDYVWFREPIVCATAGLSSFGYTTGDCPLAESVGRRIINWPCDVPESDVPALLNIFKKCHAGL